MKTEITKTKLNKKKLKLKFKYSNSSFANGVIRSSCLLTKRVKVVLHKLDHVNVVLDFTTVIN